MELVDTGVVCQACNKGKVTAKVESVTDTPFESMPIGPGSRSHYYLSVTSIYCEQCGIKYEFPPGRPNAVSEILEAARRKERESDAGFW